MLVIWLLLYAASVSSEIEDGLQYLVGAGKKDCFYRDLVKGDLLDFDLQVLSGGEVDISMRIQSLQSGKEYLNEFRQTEISKEIDIEEDGPVEICFDNSHSPFSEKVIYFNLGIDESENKTGLDHEQLFLGFDLPKDIYSNSDEIEIILERIGIKFESIEKLQTFYRSRYKRHRFLQEYNLWLITWFSTSSCVVMVMVGLLQVYLIRNLFASKNSHGMQNGL